MEPQPLDQTDLGVGFRCILRGGIGSLQEKEPRRRRGGSVGLALGLIDPPGGGLAHVALWSRFRSSRIPIHIRDMEIRLIASISSFGRRINSVLCSLAPKNTKSPKLVEFVSLNL
jgi:hypothetical protein